MKTIKQIADNLGISKQKAYRFIRNNRISEAHREAGVMWYDDVAVSLVNEHFEKAEHVSEAHREATNSDVVEAVINMLKKELEVKNKQIDELTEALREAQQAVTTAQALHAGTMQKQLSDGKGLFKRIFKRE
jgi:hypothetical protein